MCATGLGNSESKTVASDAVLINQVAMEHLPEPPAGLCELHRERFGPAERRIYSGPLF